MHLLKIYKCKFKKTLVYVDVDLRQLVNKVPKGASFTILSDSCHSGGLIDNEKEQIGPSSSSSSFFPSIKTNLLNNLHIKPKTIPFESILQHLASLTKINVSDIGTHLLEFFGDDASLRIRLPQLELELLKADEGILLSGCQANETSADMSPADNSGRKSYGAFSDAVQTVLKEKKCPLSNREIVRLARKVLELHHFEQHPCLYCSDENADATFLLQPPVETESSCI